MMHNGGPYDVGNCIRSPMNQDDRSLLLMFEVIDTHAM